MDPKSTSPSASPAAASNKSSRSAFQPRLYEGERLETVAGYQTLFKFLPSTSSSTTSSSPRSRCGTSHGGSSTAAASAQSLGLAPSTSKPLVVYIPGTGHWARIAYGGHAGSRPEDFLAYWLNRVGFDFLAISYPLESQPAVLESLPASTDFHIAEWGKQAAKTARRVLDENCERQWAAGEVVLVAWSMAGKILKPFMRSARDCGLDVKLFVSLAATPGGITGLQPLVSFPSASKVNQSGFYSLPLRTFLPQLHEVNELNASRTIIDDEVYLREYCGDVPAGLMGWRIPHADSSLSNKDQKNRESVSAAWGALQDAGPTCEDFEIYPFIAIIRPTLPSDLRHSLADSVTWGAVLTYKLIADIQAVPPERYQDSFDRWRELTQLVQSAPERMTISVTGNHFFFLGEKGARETAQAIIDLLGRMESIQSQMTDLLQGL